MACSVGVDFSAKLMASLAKNFEVFLNYKNLLDGYTNLGGKFIELLVT